MDITTRQARFIRSAIKAARAPWTGLLDELAYGPPSRNVWIRAYQRTRWYNPIVPANALLGDEAPVYPTTTGSIVVITTGQWTGPLAIPIPTRVYSRHALPPTENVADHPAPRGRHRRPKHSSD